MKKGHIMNYSDEAFLIKISKLLEVNDELFDLSSVYLHYFPTDLKDFSNKELRRDNLLQKPPQVKVINFCFNNYTEYIFPHLLYKSMANIVEKIGTNHINDDVCLMGSGEQGIVSIDMAEEWVYNHEDEYKPKRSLKEVFIALLEAELVSETFGKKCEWLPKDYEKTVFELSDEEGNKASFNIKDIKVNTDFKKTTSLLTTMEKDFFHYVDNVRVYYEELKSNKPDKLGLIIGNALEKQFWAEFESQEFTVFVTDTGEYLEIRVETEYLHERKQAFRTALRNLGSAGKKVK